MEVKPKLKIGDKVLDKSDGKIGTVKRIDNKCSKLYDNTYANPGHLEYYVSWPNGAWTRHYVAVIDYPVLKSDNVVAATDAVILLFGRKNKKRAKPKSTPRRVSRKGSSPEKPN